MDIQPKSFIRLFLRSSYENLLDLSDSSLRTEDGCVFEIHRIILAKENRYFRAMFCGIGRNRRDFLIPGIRGEILDLILTYIYNGTVHLTELNVCELLVASDYLLANSLTSRIKKYIEIHMDLDNCISIYMTALKINHDDIERWGYRYIQTHFGAILNHETAKFGDISLDTMKRFLNDKNLCVRNERETWFSIVKWVEQDAFNRLRCVPDLIQCLMVSDMDESLTKEIFFSDIVANNPFCKDLNEIKNEEFINGLDMFIEYRLKIFTASPNLHSRRRPECLHLILRYQVQADGSADSVQVYLTYDENLDLWRKLGETYFCPTHFMAIDYDVYMFDAFRSSSGIVFNLMENEWREMINMPTPRVSYQLVSLRNMLYVIGGKSVLTGVEMLELEYYNPYLNMWFQARPMLIPVTSYSAALLQDSIFVIGRRPEHLMEFEMIAQVYNVENDSWAVFSTPNVFRFDFALTAYHEKLYIIGGSNGSNLLESVEVFDLDQNMWRLITNLPCAYYFPKTVILNDKLVVFEGIWKDPKYFRKYPPVFWNEDKVAWEALDTFLSLKDLEQYLFCTIDDSEKIYTILRENRDPATQFEKSHFA